MFSSVSRNVRRANEAMVRANRNNAKWMQRYTERVREQQDRFTRFRDAIRKSFSFVPMIRAGLSAMWAGMTALVASLFAPQVAQTLRGPNRLAMNRDGMFGKRGRGKRRRNKATKARAGHKSDMSTKTYEAMEPRQMLAADLMVSLMGSDLLIEDVSAMNDNVLTVQTDSGTGMTTVTATNGGMFDSGVPTGFAVSSAGGTDNVLTFNTADVSNFTLDGADGDDSLTAEDVSSGDFDLTFEGGAGTDSFTLDNATIAGLNPVAGESQLLAGETLSGSGVLNSSFDGDATSVITASGGTLSIGDGSASGFSTDGAVAVVASAALHLNDTGTVSPLGVSTTVEAGGTLSTGADNLELTGGDELTGDGEVADSVRLGAGTLSGNLTITGEVDGVTASGAGTVSPGNSPGAITSTTLVLNLGDTLAIDILDGGVAGSDYDQYVATDSATLGGTLNLTTTGYTPEAGDVLTIVSSPAISGTFDAVAGATHFRSGVASPTADLQDGDVLGFAGRFFRIEYSAPAVT